MTPRSRCPGCGRGIPWYENIPLLSFTLLGARCRGCRAPISWRYPLVEALTGGLFALAAWLLVLRWPGGWKEPLRYLHLAVAFPYVAALVALAFIDLAHRILPDRITKPGMALGVACSAALPWLQPVGWLPSLPPAGAAVVLSAAGAAAGYGCLWLVAWGGERVFRREAMGLGDAKLLGMAGAFTGPAGVLLAVVGGLLLGLLLGLVEQVRTKDPSFPFGPALAAGGAAAFLAPAESAAGLEALLAFSGDPRGGIVLAAACTALLLWIRGRLPRTLFLVFLLLMALLAALNGLLLVRGA